jgi:hypothetical protein
MDDGTRKNQHFRMIRAEYEELYRASKPPGTEILIHGTPKQINDNPPDEEET